MGDAEMRSITIELMEDEYKTLVTALNYYGQGCLESSMMLLDRRPRGLSIEAALETSDKTKRCSDIAFEIQGKVQKAWQENPHETP
jgi:hypothetical protein